MEEIPYIRAGTTYYKMVMSPTINGDFNEVLVPWTLETIRLDLGNQYLGRIPKYDGFTCIPSHVDFKKVYFGFYNTYSPLDKSPEQGSIEYSLRNYPNSNFFSVYRL
ncbi:hypothetical protein K8352_17455, partial [Flavobacteriaceae bacterium F89]|nr:hypothetical protein [Cerina litoralis]